jgi:mannosyltransferase OCH1-like enzyme
MNQLESLAYLGEIIGAVAVVVSLIYLAIQVRQNTHAQRTENFSRALDRVAAMQATLSQDSEAAVILSKGVVEPTSLTPGERLQFTWAMYELFGAFEFMFLVSSDAAIPEEVWQRWSAAVAWWLSFPGVQTWWQIRPIPFTRRFTSYVDALLKDNPTDVQITRRYQDFLASGERRG